MQVQNKVAHGIAGYYLSTAARFVLVVVLLIPVVKMADGSFRITLYCPLLPDFFTIFWVLLALCLDLR